MRPAKGTGKGRRELLNDSVAFAKLAAATDLKTGARLREEIRQKVRRMDAKFHASGNVSIKVEFVNGALRLVAFQEGKIYVTSPIRVGSVKGLPSSDFCLQRQS